MEAIWCMTGKARIGAMRVDHGPSRASYGRGGRGGLLRQGAIPLEQPLLPRGCMTEVLLTIVKHHKTR